MQKQNIWCYKFFKSFLRLFIPDDPPRYYNFYNINI